MTHFLPENLIGDAVPLPSHIPNESAAHLFAKAEVEAVNLALAAGRPLLVRGEPGTGKTQLARAVAKKQGWPLVTKVLDAETSPRDLLYEFDAVGRLAAAQVAGLDDGGSPEDRRDSVALYNFIQPGVLWWGFQFESASRREKAGPPKEPQGWRRDKDPVVVLIDEIDKAEPSVPNGLLGALGDGSFAVPEEEEPVRLSGAAPLVVVTTNDTRPLPAAFLRRCVVLELSVPDEKGPEEVRRWLLERGERHFGSATGWPNPVGPEVLKAAAEIITQHRVALDGATLRPGLAEYLDLVRAVRALKSADAARVKLVADLATYVCRKGTSRT